MFIYLLSSYEYIFPLLLEREEGRKRNIDVREKYQLVASHTRADKGLYMPRPEIQPATQVHALTGNCSYTFELQDDALTNWATLASADTMDILEANQFLIDNELNAHKYNHLPKVWVHQLFRSSI